jgi:hypothetical protein
MPVLDFTEIPQANLAGGMADTFELFARDFLEYRGYKILSGPDRGADAGRDLIVEEVRTGVGGETRVRWLVSCKHKAHSGQSVTLKDEMDVMDRVAMHLCSGFIGFYSTVPASSITDKLEGIREQGKLEIQIFHRERIESDLFRASEGLNIAARYFPVSFNKWRKENFELALALSRLGMPQPVAFRVPGEDQLLTVEEVQARFPTGNRYAWSAITRDFIFFNNQLGLTHVLRDGEWTDLITKEQLDKETEEAVRRMAVELAAEKRGEEPQ